MSEQKYVSIVFAYEAGKGDWYRSPHQLIGQSLEEMSISSVMYGRDSATFPVSCPLDAKIVLDKAGLSIDPSLKESIKEASLPRDDSKVFPVRVPAPEQF